MTYAGGFEQEDSSVPPGDGEERHDDEELADALAEQIASITSAIPIVSSEQLSDLPPPFAALRQDQPNGFPPPMPPPSGTPVVPPSYWPIAPPDGFPPPQGEVWRIGEPDQPAPNEFDSPEPAGPERWAPEWATPTPTTHEQPFAEAPQPAPAAPEWPEPRPFDRQDDAAVNDDTVEAPPAPVFDPSAFLGAPPPAPHTAVIPPPGSELPGRPPRRSLDDGQLAAILSDASPDEGGTAAAMDRLEEQLRLREQDAREFSTWERSMMAIGTPEAVDAVETARAEFAAASAPTSRAPAPVAQEEELVADAISPEPPSPLDEPVVPETPAELYIPDLSYIPNLDYDPGIQLDDAVDDDDAVDEGDRIPQADTLDAFFDITPDAETGAVLIAEPIGAAVASTAPPAGFDFTPPQTSSPLETGVAEEPLGAPLSSLDEPAPHPQAAVPPAFRPEESGPEPTPLERRAARGVSLFWMWFSVNSSVIGFGFGAVLLSLGMSVRQSVIAALAGVALSFLPLGLASLAGKWSGQPTMIVSRAVFGINGNVLPAIVAVVTRVFWGGALLWVLSIGAAHVLVTAGLDAGLGEFRIGVIALGAAFVIALLVAFFGYTLLARVSLVFSILSAALIAGVIALTWQHIDLTTALTVDDGPWILVVTGAVLVFSAVGLAWANSGSDVARYQRPGGSGASSMLWSTVGMGLPSFILIAYGALLAASQPQLGVQLASDPLGALATLLPAWYPLPLLAALALGIVSAIVMTIYSASFALQATRLPIRRSFGVLVAGVLVAAVAIGMLLSFDGFADVARDAATTLAVPVAAWVGLFCSDVMIRNHRYDAPSLLRTGGVYPSINWVNLVMLVIASAIGFGLTTGTVAGFDWQGYLMPALGIDSADVLGASDFGVLIALVLGLLTPIVSGIPAIRRQERAQA